MQPELCACYKYGRWRHVETKRTLQYFFVPQNRSSEPQSFVERTNFWVQMASVTGVFKVQSNQMYCWLAHSLSIKFGVQRFPSDWFLMDRVTKFSSVQPKFAPDNQGLFFSHNFHFPVKCKQNLNISLPILLVACWGNYLTHTVYSWPQPQTDFMIIPVLIACNWSLLPSPNHTSHLGSEY